MNFLKQIFVSYSLVLLLSSLFLGLGLAALPVAPARADFPLAARGQTSQTVVNDSFIASATPPTFPVTALITPTNGITVTNPWPTFDWADAVDPDGVVSYTLLISGSQPLPIWGQATTAAVTSPVSIYTPTQSLPNGVYTWSVQAYDPLGNGSGYVPPATFTMETILTFPPNPLIAPANGVTVTTSRPIFAWLDASNPSGGLISYTLLITSSGVATNIWGQTTTATVTVTGSTYSPAETLPNDIYTWTVQATDSVGQVSGYASPYSFTVASQSSNIYLPIVLKEYPKSVCPTTSPNVYETIPFQGAPADHPDYLHADLNLGVRGYTSTIAFLGLVDYSEGGRVDAPQLAGLFEPNRLPTFQGVYQVNGWNWTCDAPHGCLDSPITIPKVTMAELATTPDEPIYIPERGPDIFQGVYRALVLYAEEQRITLGYIREDTVAHGYAVHLEDFCVDPNLLALYRAQVDQAGQHFTGQLPGLRNNQPVGIALGTAIKVVIRDRGTFLDPRSRKDWWQGY